MQANTIYHICSRKVWAAALKAGIYTRHSQDCDDHFIHFSTREQVEGSAAAFFAREADLVLLAVRSDLLGPALRWEAIPDGRKFPHLYGDLPLTVVDNVANLPLGADGRHRFPW